MPAPSPDYLFVYGTLLRRARHPMAAMLAARADFIGEGRYRGRLYRVAHYPGVVPSDAADDVVFGDVYALRHPARLWPRLDAYEGCGPQAPRPPQYRRTLQTIAIADGQTLDAFVYLYNRPMARLRRIRSGRFLPPAIGGAT
jgi:gamma-glutamylcyclotransferase (GGCT)/AIG2-like uncharacterized protein YtfP